MAAAITTPIITAMKVDVVSAKIVESRTKPGRLYCALRHMVVNMVLSPSSVKKTMPAAESKVEIGIAVPALIVCL